MDSFRLGPDGIYRCDAFRQFIWQEHGFGTRNASPRADVTLRQVHSSTVVNAMSLRDREKEGDALITDRVGTSIGVRTADCVPVLLLDPTNRAVAVVHAGWRGTAAEVVKCALEAMTHEFGTEPEDVYAALGPCIRPCCYEVGAEVAQKFSALFPEWSIENQHVKTRLDLAEANRRQLKAAGVKGGLIFDCCLCTTCQSEQLYSFRREPENPGRMVSAISRLA